MLVNTYKTKNEFFIFYIFPMLEHIIKDISPAHLSYVKQFRELYGKLRESGLSHELTVNQIVYGTTGALGELGELGALGALELPFPECMRLREWYKDFYHNRYTQLICRGKTHEDAHDAAKQEAESEAVSIEEYKTFQFMCVNFPEIALLISHVKTISAYWYIHANEAVANGGDIAFSIGFFCGKYPELRHL